MQATLIAAALLSTFGSSVLAAPIADTLYRGGTILTVTEEQPTAEAIAIKNGKIIAVGYEQDLKKYRGKGTKVIDLQGKTMIPGFIDAHGHVFNTGIQALSANLLAPPDGDVTNIASLQQKLRDWAAKPGNAAHGIIMGFGYDDSQLAEQRHPTRQELDAVSKDLPVLIIHQSGHLASLNSKALELAGFTASSKDPEGGKIRRESGSQQPNGVLEETAFFGALFPMFAKLGPKENAAILKAGIDLYTRYGYTTAQEGRASSSAVKTMYALAKKHQLKIDIVAYPDIQTARDVIKAPYLSHDYFNHFRVGGAKLNLDGSPQGKTAWLTQPYFKPPEGQKEGYAGYGSMNDKDALKYVDMAMVNGWQLLTHVNGDAAIEQLIRSVRSAEEARGKSDRRFVAIHAQTARVDQVDAFKELGIMPSFFPMHTFYWGDWHRDSVLGPERATNISPTGWALERGMIFTSHHDAPVALPNSMRVWSATVNRVTRTGEILGPDQRVSPLVGLKAQTKWAAWQYFEEHNKGTLEPGKVADLVILSDNPLEGDPMRIADITVEQTIKAGNTIFRRADMAKADASCVASPKCAKLSAHAMTEAGLAPHSH
ncbi:amidohydrolase [Chitinibacteraceae bacterium HSL-7]